MSKHPKAGRAIRKLRKAQSAGDALRIIQKLDPQTKVQILMSKGN